MSDTITTAIKDSRRETRIVTLRPDSAAEYEDFCSALLIECEDSVDGNKVHEFWGTDEGGEWRVHVRHIEVGE